MIEEASAATQVGVIAAALGDLPSGFEELRLEWVDHHQASAGEVFGGPPEALAVALVVLRVDLAVVLEDLPVVLAAETVKAGSVQ